MGFAGGGEGGAALGWGVGREGVGKLGDTCILTASCSLVGVEI